MTTATDPNSVYVTMPATSPQAGALSGFKRIDSTDYVQSRLATRVWSFGFAVSDALHDPGIDRNLADLGVVTTPGSPVDFARLVA